LKENNSANAGFSEAENTTGYRLSVTSY